MRIGSYDVVRELGRGGMGVVYEGRGADGSRVAIKVLLDPGAAGPEGLERFRREARACRELAHPNVVRYLDAGVEQGRPYLVLEYLEGEDLERHLARHGRLDPDDAARLVADLADGLAAAHARGVLHRDVKPANVILVEGRPVLTDFGLARAAGRELERLTQTGEIVGTPAYMAPEQADGDPRRIGPPADVYALGATLYALIAGAPPFAGSGALLALLRRVIEDPAPPLRDRRPDAPPALEAVVARCLEKDPAARYPDAPSLARALRAALEAADSAAPGRARGRRVVALALGGAALVALGAAAAVGSRSPEPSAVGAAPSTGGVASSPAPSIAPTRAPSAPARDPAPLLASVRAQLDARRFAEAWAALEGVPSASRGPRWWFLRYRAGQARMEHALVYQALAGEAYRELRPRIDELPVDEQVWLLARSIYVRDVDREGLPSWDVDAALAVSLAERAGGELPPAVVQARWRVEQRRERLELERARELALAQGDAGAFLALRERHRVAVARRAGALEATANRYLGDERLLRDALFALAELCWADVSCTSALVPLGSRAPADFVRAVLADPPRVTEASFNRAVKLGERAIDRAESGRAWYVFGYLHKLLIETGAAQSQALARLALGAGLAQSARELAGAFPPARVTDAADEVERCFVRATELDPLDRAAWRELGYLRAQDARRPARHAQGVRDLRQAVSLDPRDPHTHFTLGCVLHQTSPREASEALAAATRLDPRRADAWERRWSLAEAGVGSEELRRDLDRVLADPVGLTPQELADLRLLRGRLP